MNILIDLLHPMEFHLFNLIIEKLKLNGHNVILTIRKVETLIDLLNHSGYEYHIVSKKGKGLIGLFIELISRICKISRIARKSKIELFLSGSVLSVAVVGLLKNKPSILFTEHEDEGLKSGLVFKLASKIYTPKFYERDFGKKMKKFNTLYQLNYLHPKYFTPNKGIAESLLNFDLENEKYFILRFCDWSATHDIKEKGFSKEYKDEIINFLTQEGKVYILDEGKTPEYDKYKLDIPKNEIFNVLAYSSLVISETTSISIESALLGVPVVRCTSLVDTRKGGAAIFDQLHKDGLVFSYSDEKIAFQKIEKIIVEKKPNLYWINKKNDFIKQFDDDTISLFYESIISYRK